jgi:2-methylcitrate dehydratase PrpD
MPDNTKKLVDFLVGAKFGDLPKDIVHETKRALLDSAGCALGGLHMQASRIAVEFATRVGGPEEASVFGTGKKVASVNAAFANGELINSQDFDAGAASHDTASIIAGALAQAEARDVSGEELVLAIALGHEVSTRLRAAEAQEMSVTKDGQDEVKLSHPRVFGFSGVTLAVAASAGKLLGLNREQMSNALGIASFICPPNTVMRYFSTSPVKMTKYTVFGQIAQVGVQSALLAELGFTADDDVLEGENTFFEFTAGTRGDPGVVTDGIGNKWTQSINYKKYPSNYPTAGAKDCFIQLVEENDLRPDEIQKITARIWPISERKSMRDNRLSTEEDYLFSVVYQLSCAAHRINPARWHSPEVKNDSRVVEFMKRVEFDVGCDEREFALVKAAEPGANLSAAEVQARGRTFKKRSLYRKGVNSPVEFRFSDAEIIEKFRSNVSGRMSEGAINDAVKVIFEIENSSTVSTLMKRFVL